MFLSYILLSQQGIHQIYNIHLYEKYHYSFLVLIILLAVCLCCNGLLQYVIPNGKNCRILYQRIPIFLIGSFCGKYVFEKKTLPVTSQSIFFIAIISVVTYFFSKPYWNKTIPYRYIFILLAMVFTGLFSLLGNIRIIKSITSYFSPITLEIYLCHEKVLSILSRSMTKSTKNVINFAAFVVTIILSYLLLIIVNAIHSSAKTTFNK